VSAARTVEIVNKRGLHARASAKFVKLAASFDAAVKVSKDGQTVEACSAGPGSEIAIEAEGREAAAAVEALAALVAARFDEDE
jgi:phosphocarrier protein HPr